MALVTLPVGWRFENVRWDIDVPQQVNRAGFTGTRKVIGLPGAEQWHATADVEPVATERTARRWRAFLLSLRGAENVFHLPALPTQQSYMTSQPTVTAAVAGNNAVDVNSVAGLETGMMLTIQQTNGHHRLVGIVGIAGTRVHFEPFLTANPTVGSTVEVRNPYGRMSLVERRNGWGDGNGLFVTSIKAEEAL